MSASHDMTMTSKNEPEIKNLYSKNVPSSTDLTSSTPELLKPWEKPGLAGSIRRALRTFQRYVWDDPEKPKEEKWFLLKLDIFLLTASCLGYFSKNLDQANIGNAYVSGVSLTQILDP
jgi:ACS family pantothenate transporter-like MFS transporter